MAVRRLHPEQPPSFQFNAENLAWANATIAKYPPGKEASAVLPILWRAQEQNDGWLTEPAIRVVADMLGMAYIRVYEVATFYTMFQLAPVGSKAHVQVCGTTPCMLRGAGDLIKVCKSRIHPEPHHLSADGAFSWEEVECLGSCANAPMVQVWKDTYEDLTPELFETLLEGFANGQVPKPGSQIGRTASCPEGGATSLTDPSLFDGSTIGAWKKRFADALAKSENEKQAEASAGPVATAATTAQAAERTGGSGLPGAPGPTGGYAAKPEALAASGGDEPPGRPASGRRETDGGASGDGAAADSATATAAAATGAGARAAAATPAQGPAVEDRASEAAAQRNLAQEAARAALHAAQGGRSGVSAGVDASVPSGAASAAAAGAGEIAPTKPALLASPRDGKGDDLGLIWGVGDKLHEKLNAMGIWHFDQIAEWGPAEVAWFEAEMQGFKGRVGRDKWIEQCKKLATGWRPENEAGERPKG